MVSTSLLLPVLLAALSTQPQVFTDPQGHTQLQTGQLSGPLPGDLRQAVTKYALQHRDELGLPLSSTLSAPESFGTRLGASFHLKQLVDGVEVDGAKVIVTVDRWRQVVQLSSSVVPYQSAATVWKLSSLEALQRAALATNWSMKAPTGRYYGGTKKMMFARGNEVRAGYLVYVPTLDLRENWFVAVDAATGEILWKQNRVFHAADDAKVYTPSPGAAGVGTAPLTTVPLVHFADPRDPGGFLEGDQLSMYNCCPSEGCDAANPVHRVTGTTVYNGQNVDYDLGECDRVRRATNDVGVHSSGDYIYTPVDPPPSGSTVSQSVAADSDPFVEVHAFYHVNNVYDFIRGLSSAASPLFPNESPPITAFQMRDEKLGKKPAVWTNVTLPDQNEIISSLFASGFTKATSSKLMRVDNAAFMAKENFADLMIPGIAMDVDTLMIFQGDSADFGYDAPVLWHEFGHGVIYSTAAFNSFTVDSRSGNNEGGALHEGIADFIAGAFGNNSVMGEYVGPLLAAQTGQTGALRNMDNNLSCPSVLWGEVHQDSQHFSAALWDARTEFGTTPALRDQFDATFYAALVSMTPATDFAQAAAAVANHVKLAFGAAQEARMKEIFDVRGVTNCSKVLDVTGSTDPRSYYGIGGWEAAGLANGQIVPGPYQMMIHMPKGATSLTVEAAYQGGFFGGTPQAKLLVKTGAPVTFTKSGTSLSNDADQVVAFAAAGQLQKATATLNVACGEDLYFTLGSAAQGGDTLQDVKFSFTESASACPAQADAGTDAGTSGSEDAGTVVVGGIPGGPSQAGGKVPEGCGCANAPMLAAGALLALVGLLRRRRA